MPSPPADHRDYTALVSPVSKAEVAEFRRQSKAANRFPSDVRVAPVILLVVVLGFFGLMVSAFFGLFLSLVSDSSGGPFDALPTIAPGLVIGVVAVGGFVAFAIVRGRSGRWARLLRLTRFADANALRFSPRDPDPTYPGAIFQVGSSRAAIDHFMSTGARALDFGNYRYTTGSGENRTTHDWGFIAMRLDRALPHMVLDARSNNGLFGGTNLPSGFRRDQVLSLEGDFDRHFTLYCPRQYERDALYVFAPDLMALLIDNVAAFDVEIVDDWLFVYSSTRFQMTDAATVSRVLRIVDTVGAKALAQTERYSDDRAGSRAEAGFATGATRPSDPGVVAPQGRRLRRRVPVIATIIVVGFVVFHFASVLATFGR